MATVDPVSKMLTPPDSPETDGTAAAAIHPPPPTPQSSPAVKTPQPPPAQDDETAVPTHQPSAHQDASTPEDQHQDDVEEIPRVAHHHHHHHHHPPAAAAAPRLRHELQPSSHLEPALSSPPSPSIRRSKTQSHRRTRARGAGSIDPRRRPQSHVFTDAALDPSLPPDHFATQAPAAAPPSSYRTPVDAAFDDRVFPAGPYSKAWDLVPYAPPGGVEGAGPGPAALPSLPGGRVVVPKEVRRGSVSHSRALRVKMKLNLEVEITLKARIKGDVLLTVL